MGIKGILSKQAGEAGTGIIAALTQSGKMVSSSKRKREVLLIVERYHTLVTPTAKETCDAELEKKFKARAEANVDASEQEDYCSSREGL